MGLNAFFASHMSTGHKLCVLLLEATNLTEVVTHEFLFVYDLASHNNRILTVALRSLCFIDFFHPDVHFKTVDHLVQPVNDLKLPVGELESLVIVQCFL